MRLSSKRAAWLAAMGIVASHCAQPIDAPAAYSEQLYLCAPEHAAEFDALVEQCREGYLRDQSCAGRISFRGTADSQPVQVNSPVTRVDRQTTFLADGGTARGAVVWSSAPYYAFRISLADFSGPVMPGGTLEMPTGSDFLNFEARGGNYLSDWVNETRTTEVFTSEAWQFHFSADLARGGHLDGCVSVFLSPPP